ncbi:MAG: YfbU family protein [Gemmatimonadetes bacterium]|nr:YfbU family protein [Gemmatimonadota bacterium]
MKLTRTERWILANQYRILAKLEPENAATYRGYIEALERGYANVIDRLSEHVLRDDTTHRESDEVDEILAMYDALQRSFRTLEDSFGIEEWRVRFPGFNQDDEADYLGYSRFALSREGRHPNLATEGNLSTPSPMLKQYRRMMDEWKKRGGSGQLDQHDLVAILSTARR